MLFFAAQHTCLIKVLNKNGLNISPQFCTLPRTLHFSIITPTNLTRLEAHLTRNRRELAWPTFLAEEAEGGGVHRFIFVSEYQYKISP